MADLVQFCDDWGRETGDARYSVLGQLFGRIGDWWDDDEQGVPQTLAAAIDRAVQDSLPEVLEEKNPANGTQLAALLAERIHPLLVPTREWFARGGGGSSP
ncbi:MAG: hypothetical protein M3083_11920 [Actinomycetota bacterium]|nr:hypothetical protein [Actinomycetota bacterium]